MAKILESFEFRKWTRNSKYPWNEWLDGKIRRFTRGEDFTCESRRFVSACHEAAKRMRLHVRTRVLDETTVVIQAYFGENAIGDKPC